MTTDELATGLTNAAVITMSVVVSSFALFYTMLAGKMYGRTAALRKLSFRCVAATLMRPNLGFRVGVAFVAIGFAFVAFYRSTGEQSPEGVKLIVSVGMTLTVLSSAGLAVVRVTTSHFMRCWRPAVKAPAIPRLVEGG